MKSPLAIALAFILVLCSAENGRENNTEASLYVNQRGEVPAANHLIMQPLVADGHESDQKEGLNLHDDGRDSNGTPIKLSL